VAGKSLGRLRFHSFCWPSCLYLWQRVSGGAAWRNKEGESWLSLLPFAGVPGLTEGAFVWGTTTNTSGGR
jgi:hypothetical protein